MELPTLKLSDKQLSKVADIFGDLGTVTVAAAIVPSLLSKFHPIHFFVGGMISIIFWIISIKVSSSWTQ